MKTVVVLGSTGSVGRQALEVIDYLGFRVRGLVGGANSDLLARQIAKYSPDWAVLASGRPFYPAGSTKMAFGSEAAAGYAREHGADIVIAAISGVAGLLPTWNAISSGATVALANKEALVTAGALMMQAAGQAGAKILPIDSEHAAIWQCLQGSKNEDIKKLILTASGGPFRNRSREQLQKVTVTDALLHPTWQMGHKITIDSATLMNKGLEIIEAHWLFGMAYDNIEVVVHPQSVVHSLVEFVDGSLLAQLSWPDMRLPIQQALTYPDRLQALTPALNLAQLGQLNFEAPRQDVFPLLGLAIDAGKAGAGYPIALNAANEVAVAAFLAEEITFTDISRLVAMVLDNHKVIALDSLESVLFVDAATKNEARQLLASL